MTQPPLPELPTVPVDVLDQVRTLHARCQDGIHDYCYHGEADWSCDTMRIIDGPEGMSHR